MKIHIEMDFNGYADAVKDLTDALNTFLDNAPTLMLKAKNVKELVDRLTPTFEEPAATTEEPTSTTEEPAATAEEASATPAEEAPAV